MGDPACFLDATCLTCGRFLDSGELDDQTTCPHCGAELVGRKEQGGHGPGRRPGP